MNRVLRVNPRLLVAALSVVVAVGIFVATMPASDAVIIAGPGVTIYYSSPAMTTVVGARGTGCCGAVINWGITTAYKKFEKIYCTDQICPN